jgi:3-hydroxyisobutyrate dehydrogenase-like beta-hydroxyacid dehydrogenase
VPDRVGFIGLGIMGSRQAANLRRAGYELTVFNRTRETAEAWAAEYEATVAATPREAAEGADAVITMVVDGPQVEEMLFGDDGAVAGAPGGTLFIDCTTIAPADARRIGATLHDQGHGFVDAPVTGSAPKAQDGTLTIMVGATDEDMDRARPVLEAMGKLIVHVGEVGHGQAVKVISNSVAAVNCATIAQALVVARRGGVDLDKLVEVMKGGAANSTMLELKGQRMLDHDFTPLFKLEHMLKDVGFCLDEARVAGAPFPFAALAREFYSAGVGQGLGEQDFAAVLEVLEGLAATRV